MSRSFCCPNVYYGLFQEEYPIFSLSLSLTNLWVLSAKGTPAQFAYSKFVHFILVMTGKHNRASLLHNIRPSCQLCSHKQSVKHVSTPRACTVRVLCSTSWRGDSRDMLAQSVLGAWSLISVGARPASGFRVFWLWYQSLLFRTCHVVKAAAFGLIAAQGLLRAGLAGLSRLALLWQLSAIRRGRARGAALEPRSLPPCAAPASPPRNVRSPGGQGTAQGSTALPAGCHPAGSRDSDLSFCWPGERRCLWEGQANGRRCRNAGGKK